MKEDPTTNRAGKRHPPDQKKRKKINTLVDTLRRNLEPKRVSIQIERCDADEKRNRKSRSPDKSPRSARKPLEGDDSESEPLSNLLSRGAKHHAEAKGAFSLSATSDVLTSNLVKKDAKKDTVRIGRMPYKMDEKKPDSVKKEENIVKKAQKEDVKVKPVEKAGKGEADAKKVVDTNAKCAVKPAKGKCAKPDVSDCKEGVSIDGVDQDKDVLSGSKSPVLGKPCPVQQKSSVKKLLENTIRNRLKRASDEGDRSSPPAKKRKVGRPPKAKSDSPKPSKLKRSVDSEANVGKVSKSDTSLKKRGRKKKASEATALQETPERAINQKNVTVIKEKDEKVRELAADGDEKLSVKKVKFASDDDSPLSTKAKEKKPKNETEKKQKKRQETDASDSEVEKEKVKKGKGKKEEKTEASDNETKRKPKKQTTKDEKMDGSDTENEKPRKIKNKKQETDASDTEHEKEKANKTTKKKKKVVESSDSEEEEKSKAKVNKKPKKKVEKNESSDSESEEKQKAAKKTVKKKTEKVETSDSESEEKQKPTKKVGKKKSEKAESSDSDSEEKPKPTKKTAKKKDKSESEASDTGQQSKKLKMAKKVVKLRSRFRRKRVASLNARAKVTCMVDEDEEPIDFNHYITMFPVIVGDDVILRKKKKKGIFMRKPRKQRQPEIPPMEMKDLIVPKRMASLNATAMMAASTDLDRRKKDEDGIKSPVMRKEEEEENPKKEETNEKEKKSTKKSEEQAKKGVKKAEEPPKPDIDVYEFHCDDKPVKTPKKKCEVEKKNKEIPLKKRKRVEAKESPVASPVAAPEVKDEKISPVKLPEPVSETKESSDEQHQTQQGVLDLRSPQSLAIPPAVDALLKNSDAVTISGVYIDARCSSQSSSHSYVISGSMQAYNYSVATRTEERRTVTPPPAQPTVAKVRPYNPLGALCGMRIPDQSQPQPQCPPASDHHWRPHDPKPPPSQPGEHSHTSAFQAPAHQPPTPGWYQPAGPLIHTPYKPPERQSPEPSTSRPISPPQEKKEEPAASPEKPRSPPPEWHGAPPERAFHHYYPHYPPAPYSFYHYPPLPPSSSTQSRDGYSGYPGPPLPHPHPVYPYQGTSYYPPPPPPSHQGYPAYDPYDPYRQSTNSLVPPPNGSPGSSYPVRPAPHLVRPTVLPAPTPYYPPYYGCHQQTAPAPPAHYDPRHMRCSCPSRSPTCPKNVQPGPLTGEGVGPGYLVENPHTPMAPGPRALASPASGSVPRNMESQTPGSGAKVVDSETAPVTKKYLSAKEMKKLLKSIDLETCRKVWKQKKAERKRQKVEKRKISLLSEYSSADDFQDNIPLKYLAKEIKLEKIDEFDSELTNSSCDSHLLSVKTECVKVEDDRRTPPVFEEPVQVQESESVDKQTDPPACDEPAQVEKPHKGESQPVIRRKRRKKRNLQPKKVLEPRIRRKRGRKPKPVAATSITPVKRTASVNGRGSGARGPSRLNSVTPTEVRAPSRVEEKAPSQERNEKPSCGWSWYGEPYEAKVYLSNDDPPVLRRCYPSMRHEEGEIIRVRDSVILRSGTRANDLPYVAKVAAMWDNPDDGEMMISILWFYRPEHTDRGRKFGDRCDEVFASRHRDTTYVACIEDKCHVLTYNEYCRYRAMTNRMDEGDWPPASPPVVPSLPRDTEGVNSSHLSRVDRMPTIKMGADRVFLCRKVYDYRQKRILKNPA